MLKAGQLVVQMLAAEESITMPDGSRKATFTQETWAIVPPSLPPPLFSKPCSVLTQETWVLVKPLPPPPPSARPFATL